MKRAISVAVTAVALTGAILAPVAAGHNIKYDSTLTAKFKKGGGQGAGTFSGTVDSLKPRCEANRKVNVLLRGTDSDTTVGTDQTDLVGDWELVSTTAVAPGTYYAVAPRKVLRKKSGHRHICKRAQSSDVTVK